MNYLDEILYCQLALTQTEGIGEKSARRLLQKFGSAKAIFDAPLRELAAVEGMGDKKVKATKRRIDALKVERELDFIRKNQVQALFLTDEGYPERLKDCPDAPLMIYYRGNGLLNNIRTVSIVGTRKHTEYGQKATEDLVEGLQAYDVTIISGLAYGIDIIAHRKAVQHGIPTIGVLAHGLDRIYPHAHVQVAREMIQNGGLLTEYPSGTNVDRSNFPMRNRIVAGMSDVTVVIETNIKGGAMITAKLAVNYNREVAAFPGRATDIKSRGCNYLLKTNMAHTIEGADDLAKLMGWDDKRTNAMQIKLFTDLTFEEKAVIDILQSRESMHIDELQIKLGKNGTQLASLLLNLELQKVICALPGKKYKIQ